MHVNLRATPFFLLFSEALSIGFRPCQLLGPAYPPVKLDTDSKEFTESLTNLTHGFDKLVGGATGPNGQISPNTSFSIALFSTNKGEAADEPSFWEYHYTSPDLKKTSKSSKGVKDVNSHSVYRIGGLTEVFTIWSLLIAEGDHMFNEPVTKYLPELKNSKAKQDRLALTQWDEVTVGQLASHLGGIARDYCSGDLTAQAPHLQGLPEHAGFQRHCCAKNSTCDTNEFLKQISTRRPITDPGVTPSYSNLAFQLLGYILEKQTGQNYEDIVQNKILNKLGMNETSVHAPKDASHGVIPIDEKASSWALNVKGDTASKSMFSTAKDLALAGKAILNSTLLSQAQTSRWLKPLTHTSNPKNSVGAPWVIYSGGEYPNSSLIDVFTVLSNEGYKESLYSSYLGLAPDYGLGYAILSADTKKAADLNAHADAVDAVLKSVVTMAVEQTMKNFGGPWKASGSTNSSIKMNYDKYPGIFIEEFVSNGTNFLDTLSTLTGVKKTKDMSVRLYPTHSAVSGGYTRQAFRAVFQDKSELADNDTPTCVSWLDLDKFEHNGAALDEFIFTLDRSGKATTLDIPALDLKLKNVGKA